MKKSQPLPVRLDHDVKDALEADSAAQERSQAWLVNKILRGHYGLEQPAKPAKGKK